MSVPSWYEVLFAAYAVFVVGAITTILLQRRSPTATLSWIFAFIALPFISGLYYLVFGPRRLLRRRRRYGLARRSLAGKVTDYIRSSCCQTKPRLSQDADGLARVVARLGQGEPTFASGVKLLDRGDVYIDSLVRAINVAKHHVHCEYYIWEADRVGAYVRDALVEARARGIEVRILVDGVGSRSADREFWKPLTSIGGEVLHFNRLRFSFASLNFANFRTHRKIVVCDGAVGYVGGQNLHDPVSAVHSGKGAWHDMQARIDGEPVRRLQRLFLENWTYSGGIFKMDLEDVKHYFPPANEGRGLAVQVLASGPDDERASLHAFLLAAISTARYRVWITTPYFIPDEPLEAMLKIAVLRGVDVKVIVPLEGDSKVVTFASRTYCEALGAAGIHVFEYGPPMLHSKTMVVDQTMGMVGTNNLDNRSFRLNFEVAAAFYDHEVIEQLASHFVGAMAQARPFRKRRGARVAAFLESVARLSSPVL
ncbi:cardiolipin synthase [Usitatibacter palustris]|uniref:Cardiolipin synthase n=1 Tax=Usitatibacter palustris TaxID=2732487 RepID=A0A6M4H8F2_9PROT|nr:cardiolipin synthase [Usitatibacter palustris]QJR15861.1 Major cardiolipin synthase ClsA [Usitatibacter palustris]